MDTKIYENQSDYHIMTNDQYYIWLSSEDIQRLADSDVPNTAFIEYPSNFSCPYKKSKQYCSSLGIKILLMRGYPRIRDVLPEIFVYCMNDDSVNQAPQLHKFFMNLPEDAFLDGYKKSLKYLYETVNDWSQASYYIELLYQRHITKKKFQSDSEWEQLKEKLSGWADYTEIYRYMEESGE